MNPRETAEMTALINRLRNDMGLTVLLIEHDMRVVMGISDWITVLDHGERIAEGTPAEVRANPKVIEAYLGTARRITDEPPRPKRRRPNDRPSTAASAVEPRATRAPMLRLDDIQTYYGRIQALKGVTLEIAQGEIVTLLGANGAGKTTTLRTISGLQHPRVGKVVFEGNDISHVTAHKLVTQGIGHAPEGRRIFSRLSVLENLQMGAYTRNAAEQHEDLERVHDPFPSP